MNHDRSHARKPIYDFDRWSTGQIVSLNQSTAAALRLSSDGR